MTSPLVRTAIPALSLVLALGMAGCGDDSADDPTTDTPAATSDGTGDGATPGPTTDDSSTSDATEDAPVDDVNQAALLAIATAETDAGGTAYAIDDLDDDRTWEVDVAVDDRSIEVDVSADGTEVVGRDDDDDLDDDDRAGLAQAQIGLAEAIETALAEVDGTLDDAELSDDDDTFTWEVTIDAPDRDDVDVHVDVGTGDVVDVDDD